MTAPPARASTGAVTTVDGVEIGVPGLEFGFGHGSTTALSGCGSQG